MLLSIITKHTCCVEQWKIYRLSIDHRIFNIATESDDIRERQNYLETLKAGLEETKWHGWVGPALCMVCGASRGFAKRVNQRER